MLTQKLWNRIIDEHRHLASKLTDPYINVTYRASADAPMVNAVAGIVPYPKADRVVIEADTISGLEGLICHYFIEGTITDVLIAINGDGDGTNPLDEYSHMFLYRKANNFQMEDLTKLEPSYVDEVRCLMEESYLVKYTVGPSGALRKLVERH